MKIRTAARPAPLSRRALVLAGASLLAACGGGGGGDTGQVAPVAPSLDIRSDVAGEARAAFTVTFYFGAPVHLPTGVVPFALTGASVVKDSFHQVNDRTYAVRLEPRDNARGLADLRVPAGAFLDATGLVSNTVAYEFAQPYNTLRPLPTLSFTGPVDLLGFITGPAVFTLSFPAALDVALDPAALLVSTGTVSGFTRASAAGQPDVYRFEYAPPAATVGVVAIELPRGAVTVGGIGNDLGTWSYGIRTP